VSLEDAGGFPGGRPSGDRKHVLAARLGDELWARLAPALARAEFDVNRIPSVESAFELVRLIPFHVVLAGFQEPDAAIDELLAAIRAADAKSHAASVLLFAPPAHLAAAQTYLVRGADQVLATSLDPLALQEPILRLLRARPRLSLRVMARLTVRLGEGLSRLLCQTRDLSRGGMLALTENRYPLGTPIHFVLELPDPFGGAHGEAEVVRQAIRGRDPDDGLGLRFLSFASDGESRLVAFLQSHGA
jgi:DNA-binding response OmpR family regulator